MTPAVEYQNLSGRSSKNYRGISIIQHFHPSELNCIICLMDVMSSPLYKSYINFLISELTNVPCEALNLKIMLLGHPLEF